MKTITLTFFITFFILSMNSLLSNAQELTILHTNDMHSKLTGYGPESEYSPTVLENDNTLGGFARLSTLFKQAKLKSPDGTLILDAGDFLMGSLFHVAEEETGFQLNLMKEIGYDYITLGNHEFDFGPKALAQILNTANKKGGFPQIIASNTVFSEKSNEDNDLETLFTSNVIKPYVIVNRNGLKIGIFGLMGINAADVAPASKPVSFSKPQKVAKEMSEFLKNEQKVDIVICLSHSGIYPNSDNTGYIGEDIEIAEKAPLIDIIISGHTHIKTANAIKIGNTYVVQTGSSVQNLGEIKLKVENRKISKFDYKLIPVDDKIEGDYAIIAKIEGQKNFINKKYLSSINLSYQTIVAKANFALTLNFENLETSNLGPFLAEATKYYVENNGTDVDFSLITSGTIREDILKGKNGIITVPDIFRVMSLGKGYDDVPGYPLAKVYITAKEVKKLMEVLVMSRASGGDGFLFFSGIKVYINPEKGMLRKVQKIEINGKKLDYSKKNKKLYSITANTYLLSFIGEIKKMSHGLVSVTPKDKDGNPVIDMKNQLIDIDPNKAGVQEAKEWIAVIEFMKSFNKNSDNIPVIPNKYKKPVKSVIEIKE